MAFFKRKLKRGRVDLGRFEAPPIVDPPPIEQVADDAFLIARTAVRMVVKNRIIVDAIREDRDFDAAAMSELAQRELTVLAEQNDALVAAQVSERNASVYRSLAHALRLAAADTDLVEVIVEEARVAAWSELSTVLRGRLSSMDPSRDPSYRSEREARLRQLIDVDLARLELERLPEY